MVTRHPGNTGRIILCAVLALFVLQMAGCAGGHGMRQPSLYGGETASASPSASVGDSLATPESEQTQRAQRGAATQVRSNEQSPDKVPDLEPSSVSAEALQSASRGLTLSTGGTDLDDSAPAVDDDIWRKFELAQEYYLMGVTANREASWEEAQYYFEKGLKVLAKLDVEDDSSATPEAVKYNQMLQNFVADYRVSLRSLGRLESEVSAGVVVERFGDLEQNLGADSIRVYNRETAPRVTYDLPVVMNDRVKKSVVYFQTVAHDAFAKYLRRSQKYTPMMLRIIDEYGLPHDLIYLSLVESGYNPHAYSWARAMGLWQFIASTGRMYNLNRSWWIDERKDPIKATHAACQFLKDLYTKYGAWELAMAAYNGGPGRVSRTMKKQKTADFWKLRLRRQTMDYVPLIYAAAIIGKNPEKYGFVDIEKEPEVVWDEVEIDRCLELSTVADRLGCSLKKIKELNPELLRKYTPPNVKKYTLKIPVGAKKKFLAAYDSMPSPKETSWARHKIRRGETVGTIAARYGVSQYAILEANNLSRRSTIYAGKSLIVPVPLDSDYKGGSKSSRKRNNSDYVADNSVYTVQRNDNLWDIARAFGTSVDALRRNNYIERGSRIYVGQKLKIPANAKNLKNRSASSQPKTYASSNKGDKTSGTATKHKVRSRDTLWDIARKYGTTTAKLRRLNSLGRSSRIYPGQMLVVSDGGAKKYVVHKVRRGDTLSRLAQKYRTTMARIIANNNIADPDRLTVGAKLKIYTH